MSAWIVNLATPSGADGRRADLLVALPDLLLSEDEDVYYAHAYCGFVMRRALIIRGSLLAKLAVGLAILAVVAATSAQAMVRDNVPVSVTSSPLLPGLYVYANPGSGFLSGLGTLSLGTMHFAGLNQPGSSWPYGPFSPDGTLRAYYVGSAFVVRGLPAGNSQHFVVAGDPLAFSADDTTLALWNPPTSCYQNVTGSISLLNLGTGAITATPLSLAADMQYDFSKYRWYCDGTTAQVSFSADGQSLIFIYTDGIQSGVYQGSLSDGSVRVLVGRVGRSCPLLPTMSRDGVLLAYVRLTPLRSDDGCEAPGSAEQLVLASPDGQTLHTVALGNGPDTTSFYTWGALVISPDSRSLIASCPMKNAPLPGQTASGANTLTSEGWQLCQIDTQSGIVHHLGGMGLSPLAWPAAPVASAGPANTPINASAYLHIVAFSHSGSTRFLTLRTDPPLRGHMIKLSVTASCGKTVAECTHYQTVKLVARQTVRIVLPPYADVIDVILPAGKIGDRPYPGGFVQGFFPCSQAGCSN